MSADDDPNGKSWALLQAAHHDQQLIRVRRRIKRADRLDGYIVALSRKWLLMAKLDDSIFLNGFIALRPKDVVGVKQQRSSDRFVRRAL